MRSSRVPTPSPVQVTDSSCGSWVRKQSTMDTERVHDSSSREPKTPSPATPPTLSSAVSVTQLKSLRTRCESLLKNPLHCHIYTVVRSLHYLDHFSASSRTLQYVYIKTTNATSQWETGRLDISWAVFFSFKVMQVQ